MNKCISCKEDTKNDKYCSNKCQAVLTKKKILDRWLAGHNTEHRHVPLVIREFLLQECDYCCVQCNWSGVNPITGLSVLTIDHIDGNALNHKRTNLRVLCPNCHSMTETYGRLNTGNGKRHWRYSK